jgi:uncharacterized membrane protein
VNYWPLVGVAIVVLGFALRINPMPVVVVAGFGSAFAAGLGFGDILALLGNAFASRRTLLLFVMTLPVIGLLERAGLREHAHAWIAQLRGMTLARLLTIYLGLRQLLAMLGLTHIGGHAQTVRPLVAPMAEAAAEKTAPDLDDDQRDRTKALAASTDNVGLFFGEDVFVAFAGVVLIQDYFAHQGIALDPSAIGLWALPTAIGAFVIHAIRVHRFERSLRPRPGTADHAAH